jgi:2-hydroxy-3-keto-5-methylthiopentenyl-1-phosphate phosphatase
MNEDEVLGVPESTSAKPGFEILIDFDGTLVTTNVAIVLVEEFCPNGKFIAGEIDRKLARGEMTLREAWAAEVDLLPADRLDEMAAFAAQHTQFRAGAAEMCGWFEGTGTPATILSGGLDFYIQPILDSAGIKLPILSELVRRDPGGHLILEHPHGHETCRICGICKARAVDQRSGPGSLAVFIGDGGTDRYAAEAADVIFARHRLRTYCEAQGLPFFPFEEFGPVTERLQRWFDGSEPLPARRRRGSASTPCPISRDLFALGGPAAPAK